MSVLHCSKTSALALTILISPAFLSARTASAKNKKWFYKSNIVPRKSHVKSPGSSILKHKKIITLSRLVRSSYDVKYTTKSMESNTGSATYNPYELDPEMRALLLPDSIPTYTLFATILLDRINIKPKKISIGQAMKPSAPPPLPIPDLPGSHDPGSLNGQQYYAGKRNRRMKTK